MSAFIDHFNSVIKGAISGFDRLVFRGHLQPLLYPNGLILKNAVSAKIPFRTP